MSKDFASRADLTPKRTTFVQLSEHAWAYTAEGDPNSGVVIGPESAMVIDTTATPKMAGALIAHIRALTDKPIRHVVLTHYHAVRVLGASAYRAEGAREVIASRGTLELIRERGAQDMASEIERFPRLFENAASIPGLTWPTLVFERQLTLFLGSLEVRIIHPGAGHTKGDTIVWLPQEKTMFSGDLVEFETAAYTGDAHLADWPATLDILRGLGAEQLVPGRGPALTGRDRVNQALDFTRDFVTTLFQAAQDAAAQDLNLKQTFALTRGRMDPKFAGVFIYEHCLPFDVSRAFDEAHGIDHPRIWTAERDQQMWRELQG
jgi:glyoxylase-like metal-dependent hydrolase (beta-lactamase superfamily II)